MRSIIVLIIIATLLQVNAQNQFNKSIRLNGDQQYVEIPDAPYLNQDTFANMTIEFIFKPMEIRPSVIYSKWQFHDNAEEVTGVLWDINTTNSEDDNLRRHPYDFGYQGASDSGNFRNVRRYHNQYGYSYGTSRCQSIVINYDYNHLVMPYSTNSVPPAFLNGEEIGFGWKSDTRYATPGTPVIFGGVSPQLAEMLDTSFYFIGDIDEIRIWNRIRTSAEVRATMFEPLGEEYYTTSDSGLVAYYRFDALENLGVGDDGEANDIFDYSVNANHAQVIGGAVLVDNDWTTGIEPIRSDELVTEYRLAQNYPNPFNPLTNIEFYLPETGKVIFKIYDVLGREIQTLINKELQSGHYSINWQPENTATGVYIGQLIANNYRKSIKMILSK